MTNTLNRNGKYLRNRPFLMVTLVRRPAKGVKTEKAGWADQTGAFESFEQTMLTDRVNAVHLRDANVIIDVMNAKVVKNSLSANTDEQVINYYMEKYRDKVKEAMDIWLTDLARKTKAAQAAEPAIADGTYSLS